MILEHDVVVHLHLLFGDAFAYSCWLWVVVSIREVDYSDACLCQFLFCGFGFVDDEVTVVVEPEVGADSEMESVTLGDGLSLFIELHKKSRAIAYLCKLGQGDAWRFTIHDGASWTEFAFWSGRDVAMRTGHCYCRLCGVGMGSLEF